MSVIKERQPAIRTIEGWATSVLLEAGAGLAFLTGAAAVTGLAWGCILMVRETQLAVHSLEEEARIRTSKKTGNPK